MTSETTKIEKTKAQTAAADIAALLRARHPLLWVVTPEEARAERYIAAAAASAKYVALTWDCGTGICAMDGRIEDASCKDPSDALQVIKDRTARPERNVWIMRDFHEWCVGPSGPLVRRQIRNLARMFPTLERDRANVLIVLSPQSDIPPELAGHATVIDWPLPDRAEIGEVLDVYLRQYGEGAAPNGTREAAIAAAVGLPSDEAAACYAKSLVQTGRIDPAAVAAEKKRVIARERVLEWVDPIPGGLSAVGGLDGIKAWLATRATAFTPAARAFGLPSPKGIFLVGPPGTGKTLIGRALATGWQCPFLKFDSGALKSKFVGESEGNIRKAIKTIEAIGKCVVLIDEIEKALAGATQGAADGGVSSDQLGTLLSWMNDRTSDAFIVATSNDASALPPELLRKGRFDEIFFVDLPNESERAAVLGAALRTHGRTDEGIDVAAVAAACREFTGAEIAACVPDALYAAFADGARPITTEDLIRAAKGVVPLIKTAKEKIEALRSWAATRCKPASERPRTMVAVGPTLKAVEL